jgi:zinc transporter ZupT
VNNRTAYSSKSRLLLWSVISGIAAALGYLVAELFSQHDLSFAPYGMIGIFLVLTLFTYFINLRNVPQE